MNIESEYYYCEDSYVDDAHNSFHEEKNEDCEETDLNEVSEETPTCQSIDENCEHDDDAENEHDAILSLGM